jgi:beta-lactamase regulating signal transducer with metallopeptidase domain
MNWLVVQDLVETLAQVSVERILNALPEGVLIAGVAWILLRVVRRQNSGTRFAVWFLALLAVASLPVLGGFGEGRKLSVAGMSSGTWGSMRPAINIPAHWALFVFIAWALGAGLAMARLALGLWRLRCLHRSCTAIVVADLDPAVRNTVDAITASGALTKSVTIATSECVRVPAAIGFWKRMIVLPTWALQELPPDDLNAILLHEFAHLQRWDDWTNLLQKMVRALFFFHPAVWWIENRLTLEREMACDDIVLAQASSPRAYASSLISLAEKLHRTRGLALAQALLSRMNQMSRRVTQILDAKRPKTIAVAKPALALSAALLVLALCASPSMPGIVTFKASPNQTSANAGKLAVNREPKLAEATGGRLSSLASHAQVIPAMFNPGAAIVPRQLKGISALKPAVRLAKTAQENRFVRETFVILQTTEYDPAGSAVWTLCVWRVGNTPAERKLESAIVISSI